jgi:bacillithiol biosynthesis cysteine-adding enzyme BshC
MSIQFSDIPAGLISNPIAQLLQGNYANVYPRFGNESISDVHKELEDAWGSQERNQLVSVLKQQHKSLKLFPKQEANLLALASDDGFTVVTGQQIHPFLGPAFVWAKVKTTILKAQELSQQLGKTIVPVFWMATEDHDFDEIARVPFLGKEYVWETQSLGPVGKLDTEGIAHILQQMQQEFQSDIRVIEFLKQFEGIYQKGTTLSDASRLLIHRVFGEEGLLIVDPNQVDWKHQTKDIWLRELSDNPYNALLEQSQLMKEVGLKPPITPRHTSMFYYGKEQRLRIDRTDSGSFQTADTSFVWTLEGLHDEINEFPERFSANALLRPAYQQRILPNLLYIGGPAECIYWLQVPALIRIHGGIVPALQLRLLMHLSMLPNEKKLAGFSWPKPDWFLPENELLDKLMLQEYGNLSLTQQIPLLKAQFEQIWESLYQIKHPKLKEIKKEHEALIRSLQHTADDFLKEGFDAHVAPKIKQLKALKSTVFNEKSPQERSLFWMEWAFKLGGFPQIDKLQGPYLWLTSN